MEQIGKQGSLGYEMNDGILTITIDTNKERSQDLWQQRPTR